MNLIIDQGNTAVKLALFEGNQILSKEIFDRNDNKSQRKWLEDQNLAPLNIIVCSVTQDEPDLSFLEIKSILRLSYRTPVPIAIKYESPSTLGLDRLANAVGAWSLNKGGNSLVIDMGTCIKYDIVDSKGAYLGGIISPGLSMRFLALSQQTAQLPHLKYKELEGNFGVDTASSIRFGVQEGIKEEINGFIKRYSSEYSRLTIFMTGGDSKYFDKVYKNAIFADSDLTLKGLNEILNYNVE